MRYRGMENFSPKPCSRSGTATLPAALGAGCSILLHGPIWCAIAAIRRACSHMLTLRRLALFANL